ncbi:Plipastatin synthase subunit [Paenibacillus nuruki]|uniref:Plipastatin synthase subunit n=1 Tax=Paenibacillus nuruki TaxID=1886670 RepID=A0A1E3L9V4_9BACL|nr:non-ribosomal peptide synthetase [Paenibacillus nuruki]ODP29730.1 Plipastatin synthase subunit [Paenibacillus nuruki]
MSLSENAFTPNEYIQLPALQIPLDQARQQQKDTFAVYRFDLGAKIALYIGTLVNPIERQAVLFSAYLGWLYRISGEHEIHAVSGSTTGLFPFSLSIEDYPYFQSLVDYVASQLDASPATSPVKSETVFHFGQQIPAQPGQVMNWTLEAHATSLSIAIEYNDSLLTAATIERFADYYIRLLEGLLDNTALAIGSIDILNAQDHTIYQEMNNTAFPYQDQQTYHGAFEAAVNKYPQHTAISFQGTEYTYEELNQRANQVAHLLLRQGLQQGEFVTMYIDRSLDSVISLLGIMKAGGVYVPVDPSHPDERNHYIVQDTQSAFVLIQHKYNNKVLQLTEGITTLRGILDIEYLNLTSDPAFLINPNITVLPDDLAYVIYTSGSTGKPKGTLVAHRGVVNLGEILQREFNVTSQDVMTQFATYSFDGSVWETIAALFHGAHLFLLDAEERVSIEEFAIAIERTQTTIVTALPTVFFNQLSAYLSDEGYARLASLKLIAAAGEALYGKRVRTFQQKIGKPIEVVNAYGPTECTVCATMHKVDTTLSEDVVNVPIGRPIDNYKVYIMNEFQMLSPVGVPGEIYISTVGIAHGYLDQPEKTAAAFMPDPSGNGEKIYRSGDLAKLLADGTIEYVGRRDSQIKIRGHRIEIGEIEDSLNKYPNMQDAVVVPKVDETGQNMLVAYFTTIDGTALSPAAIKQFLSDRLPSYFVPRFVCQLDEIPISPTGKAERKKLIAYDHIEMQETATDYVAPQNETQQWIADAWSGVLNKQQIGIHDDFFEIGGDSLKVLHVLTLLKPQFPNLKIADLFAYKTIIQLAEYALQLDDKMNIEATSPMIEHTIDLVEFPARIQTSYSGLLNTTHVLLTGATGYLGSHLLYELLQQSDAHIYALVRKTGSAASIERLKGTMELYFGQEVLRDFEKRVTAVEGDLESKRLGLSDSDYEMITEHIDAIIHSAADVRHFGDTEQFAKSNIYSTAELLAIASTRQGIRFHHISTMGIPEDLSLEGKWDQVKQTGILADDLQTENMYTNSKLEAEKLIFAAGERGIPVNIYRAGNLSSQSVTGRFQRNIDSNAMYRMIKAMLLLGKAPAANQWMDFTPIDYAGRSIIHLALQPDTAGQMFHICNPQQVHYDDLIAMIQTFGYSIDVLPAKEYAEWLLDSSIEKQADALLLAMGQLDGDGAKDSPYRLANPETAKLLEQQEVFCPKPDYEFISAMLSYASSIGYFPTAPVRDVADVTVDEMISSDMNR